MMLPTLISALLLTACGHRQTVHMKTPYVLIGAGVGPAPGGVRLTEDLEERDITWGICCALQRLGYGIEHPDLAPDGSIVGARSVRSQRQLLLPSHTRTHNMENPAQPLPADEELHIQYRVDYGVGETRIDYKLAIGIYVHRDVFGFFGRYKAYDGSWSMPYFNQQFQALLDQQLNDHQADRAHTCQ